MAGVAEVHRRRIAFVLVFLGVALILTGFAVIVTHQHEIEEASQPETQPADRQAQARAMGELLVWLMILVVIFGAGLVAFFRWSRRYRAWLLRNPQPPSPSDDVWAMHRLPDDDAPEETPEEPDPRRGPEDR